jgi:acetyl esterase/lipase
MSFHLYRKVTMQTRSKWRRLPEIFYTEASQPDFQVAYGTKPMHVIKVRIPKETGPYPTLLVIHGGAWKAAYNFKQMEHICAEFSKFGIATCNIEFSRVGHANGGWPGTFIDLVHAVNKIDELATSWNLDTNNVVLLGHSSGGHLAFWLAALNKQLSNPELSNLKLSMKFSAVVSLAGILDLKEAWEKNISRNDITKLLKGALNELPEVYETTSPSALLPLAVKQVLIHGTRDKLIPYYLSESYYAKAVAMSENVSLLPIFGCGHFRLIDPTSKYWPTVRNAVLELFDR